MGGFQAAQVPFSADFLLGFTSLAVSGLRWEALGFPVQGHGEARMDRGKRLGGKRERERTGQELTGRGATFFWSQGKLSKVFFSFFLFLGGGPIPKKQTTPTVIGGF